MTQPDALDAKLARLLSPELTPPDPAFAQKTAQLVAAREALRMQRRRMLRDWLWQMAALAALLIGLALFSRLPGLGALPRGGLLAVASPLALVVALWLFASDALGSLPGPAHKRKPAA